MKRVLYLLLLLQSNLIIGQGVDNLWLMGYDCCNSIFNPMNIDFSSGTFTLNTVQRDMNINCTNGVICDKNGQLLFYSNGVYIANAQNDTMQNGSGLNPCQFTSAHTQYGLTIPQGNLIIPMPGDSMKYYLFHESADDYINTYSPFYLYYSIIDMSLDGGLGEVVQKNIVLLNDTLITGRLTACKHANGRDWWIVSHEFRKGNMYKFLITPSGILGPYSQDLQTSRDNHGGQAVFSKLGDKFAFYDPYDDLDIFDFDRCSGNFSNRIHIDINDSAAGGGVAFSSSGRFLYVSSTTYVYQFDLLTTNVEASKYVVAVWDTFYSPWPPFGTTFYLSQLAPDGKIYINCGNSTTAIHVINYPDSAGASCGFCNHCVQLPAYNGFTVPNHPNYFLGPMQGSICDSITNNIETVSSDINSWKIFPNPCKDLFYITQINDESIAKINIYNALGQQQAFKYSFSNKNNEIEFITSDFASGIYFVEINFPNKKIETILVKE